MLVTLVTLTGIHVIFEQYLHVFVWVRIGSSSNSRYLSFCEFFFTQVNNYNQDRQSLFLDPDYL